MLNDKELKDEEIKQVEGGSIKGKYNYRLDSTGKVCECRADCNGSRSNACNVKNTGRCAYNR